MIAAGKYVGKAVSAQFGTANTGTDQVAVQFEIQDGEYKGEVIDWYGFFTERAGGRTIEALGYCGCTFPGDNITDLSGLGTKPVQLVVGHEEYQGETRAKVQWVNRLGAGVGAAMDKAKALSFAERMKATILATKLGESSPPEDDTDDIPWGKAS